MSFLKKHYEKIILVIFLLVFVLTMVQLILIVKQSSKVGVDDLKFDKKSPDYVKADPSKYLPATIFEGERTWKKVTARKTENLFFTDIFCPYKSAPCPSCNKIIPMVDFANKKCSSCGAELMPIDQVQIDLEKDSDNDGISDVRELELGMNPHDPNDANNDFDNDGFSNLFEIKSETDIKSPKSHPATAYRLFVESIERKKLKFFLKRIVKKGDSKENWDIYTSEWNPDKKRMDDKFRKLGNEVSIDGAIYKILDIVPKEVEKTDPKTNSKTIEDESYIMMQAGKEDPIIVKVKSDAYENKETICIIDSFTKQKFRVIINEKFSVPTPAAESEDAYTVSKIINRDALKVQLIKTETNEVFDIGKSPIHQLIKVVKEIEERNPMRPFNPEEIPF